MTTPQERYLALLAETRAAERDALRIPTTQAILRVVRLVADAQAAYLEVPVAQRPTGIRNAPRALALVRNQPVLRRSRHSDWHPMTWRGQDN